jgi:hypothetical protein
VEPFCVRHGPDLVFDLVFFNSDVCSVCYWKLFLFCSGLDLFLEVCVKLQKSGSFVRLHRRPVFWDLYCSRAQFVWFGSTPWQFVFAREFGGDRSSGGLVESRLYLVLLKSVWLALKMMTNLKDLFGIIGTGINLGFVCICSGVCSILRKSVSSEVCSGLQKELVQHSTLRELLALLPVIWFSCIWIEFVSRTSVFVCPLFYGSVAASFRCCFVDCRQGGDCWNNWWWLHPLPLFIG